MVFSQPQSTPLVFSGITGIILYSNGVVIPVITSLLLLGIIPASLIHYTRQPACGCRRHFSQAKLLLSALIVAIELITLVSPAILAVRCDNKIPASALSLVAAVIIWAVTYAEHSCSVDPPGFFHSYLLMGFVLDGAKSIYFSRHDLCSAGGTFACAAGVTRLLLFALNKAPGTQTPGSRSSHDHGFNDLAPDYWGYSKCAIFDPTFVFKLDLPTLMGRSRSIDSELSPGLLHHRLLHSWQHSNQFRLHGLTQTCLRTWRGSVTASVTFRFALSVFSLAQPFVLYGILVALNQGEMGFWAKFTLIVTFSFVIWGKAVLRSAAAHALNGLVCRIRGGLTCLVFEKHQNLTQIDAKNSRAEKLFSSDIENIAKGLPQAMRFAFVFVDGCLAVYSLSYLVGLSSGVLALLTLIAASTAFSFSNRIIASLAAWRQDLDIRILKTSGELARLPAIKMIGLGPPISELIEKLHTTELESYKMFRVVQSACELAVAFSSLTAPAAVIGIASLCNTFTGGVSPAIVFSTWNLVSTQCNLMASLSQAYSETIMMLQSFDRIQAFLSLDERSDDRVLLEAPSTSNAVPAPVFSSQRIARGGTGASVPCIVFEHVTITPHGSNSPLYRNVSFCLQKGKITALVGKRGSGKSVLLESMLGEAKLSDGTVLVAGDVTAFNSQVVWLKNASIRDNVIGPLLFDSQRFKKVMKACLLQDDLKKLPGSDGYIIGVAGANLSGGQRQRLALARALYAEPSVFLLDDLFSSLDRRTAVSILFRLLGNDGLLRESGCTVVFATSLVESFDVADQFLVLDIAENQVALEANRGQAYIANALRTQHVSASEAVEEKQQEALRRTFDARNLPGLNFDRDLVPQEHRELRAFWLLCTAIGKRKLFFWCGLIQLVCLLDVFSKINLRAWIGGEPDSKGLFLGFCCPVLFSCLVGLFLFWSTRIRNTTNATVYLHQRLLQVTMRSTLAFMNDAGSSSIASRFSQSVSRFTGSLPTCLLKFFYYGAAFTLHCAVVLKGPKYMASVLLAIAVCVMRAYVKTSCELKHVKAKEMARLHTFFQETAAGLVHSRALRWQPHHLEHGFNLINHQQKASLYVLYTDEWLQGMSSIIACIVTTVIAACALFGDERDTAAAIGLSLHQATLLSDFIHETAHSWAAFDDTWAVISDLFLFMKAMPQEHEPPELQLSKDWPTEGKIEFKNVTARYGPGKTDVLSNISLEINPEQKVCLFGRTGSGKTSLLLALLGFLEYDGTIEIDGVDIATIPRDLLRSRIVALSQEPVPLEGSVRSNLLPYEKLAPLEGESEAERADLTTEFDQELMGLLTDVYAWEEISEKGGMDIMLADAGFSKATLQMICFARSVARYHRSTGKIVLIDEATNGVDKERDAAVQSAIWELFEGCTILQVAHLEESIHDAELSVEISKGKITHTRTGNVLPPGVVPRSREMMSPESLIGSPGPEPPSPSEPDDALEDDVLSIAVDVPPPASDVISISGAFRQAAASVASLRDSILSPRRVLSLANGTNPPSALRFGAVWEPTYDEKSASGGSSSHSDNRRSSAHRDAFVGSQVQGAQQPTQALLPALNRSCPDIQEPMDDPLRTFDNPFTSVQPLAYVQATSNVQQFSNVSRSIHHQQPPSQQQATYGQQQTFLHSRPADHEQQQLHRHQALYSQQAFPGQYPSHAQQSFFNQSEFQGQQTAYRHQSLHFQKSLYGQQRTYSQQRSHAQQPSHVQQPFQDQQLSYGQQSFHGQPSYGQQTYENQQAAYFQHQSHEQGPYSQANDEYGHSTNMMADHEAYEGDEASYSGSYDTGSGDGSDSTYLRHSIERHN